MISVMLYAVSVIRNHRPTCERCSKALASRDSSLLPCHMGIRVNPLLPLGYKINENSRYSWHNNKLKFEVRLGDHQGFHDD